MSMIGRSILTAVVLLGLGGCTTVRPITPPPNPIAAEYREAQGELQRQQAELAITGQKIEDQSRDLVEDLTRLEDSIASAAPEAGEAKRQDWLSQVQTAKAEAETHQADIKDLNQQLEMEREVSRKKDRKFAEYEFTMVEQLSARDTENAQLRAEVKTIKGQRDLYLVILITMGIGVLGYIAFRILRFLRIIPV